MKINYLFINAESQMPMDQPSSDTIWEQVGPTRYSTDEDTGALEVVVTVKLVQAV